MCRITGVQGYFDARFSMHKHTDIHTSRIPKQYEIGIHIYIDVSYVGLRKIPVCTIKMTVQSFALHSRIQTHTVLISDSKKHHVHKQGKNYVFVETADKIRDKWQN